MKDFSKCSEYESVRLTYYLIIGAIYLLCCALLIHALNRWFFPSSPLQMTSIVSEDNHWILLELAAIGAAIAFGKLLASGKKVTLRLIIGRLIIGAGLSIAAAAALMMRPNMPPIALVGLGSAFGILGQSCLEWLVRHWFGKIPDK